MKLNKAKTSRRAIREKIAKPLKMTEVEAAERYLSDRQLAYERSDSQSDGGERP